MHQQHATNPRWRGMLGRAVAPPPPPSNLIDGAARCCEVSQLKVAPTWSGPEVTRESCRQRCLNESTCTFYSYAAKWKLCETCTGCELERCPPSQGCFHQFFQSFSRDHESEDFVATPNTLGQITPLLQTTYSISLYGKAEHVVESDLRVIWVSLVGSDVFSKLLAMGVCRYNSRPPHQPLYWMHDTSANPKDAVWIHKPRGADIAVGNHSWIEVTHCPQNILAPQGSNSIGAPMWLYVAPGSGVSLNVGRTLALTSYRAVRRLLEEAFSLGSNRSCHGGMQRANLPPGHPLESIDTIQVLGHKEYFSAERRHEIVDLRAGECDILQASTKSAIRAGGATVACGREPHLFQCEPPALRRVTECESHESNVLTYRALRGPRCGSNSCYSRDASVGGGFYCPRGSEGAEE